jgi:CCR4-NOT transcriptional complex subunit CAF120
MAQQQSQYAVPRKSLLSFSHSRSNSAHGQRKLTKTPPLNRTLSGDWTQHTRKHTPPERPSSRGAGINLDTAGANLSATEQMQVSRATGTPLISLATNSTKQPEQPGMIGYVAAREREKAASKEGRNSVAVQQAILERQHQQLRAEAEAQAQQRYQMQLQATQHTHQQQMQAAQQAQQQQQAQWDQMVMAQNQQNQMAMQYGGGQQRPPMQNRNSWHSNQALGEQGSYSPQQQSPASGPPPGYQQPYGAAYYQQPPQGQQQSPGGQGQQWGRR